MECVETKFWCEILYMIGSKVFKHRSCEHDKNKSKTPPASQRNLNNVDDNIEIKKLFYGYWILYYLYPSI
jgi:hypothetical protein